MAQTKDEMGTCETQGKPLTTVDKQRLVAKGLTEKFIVRVVESLCADDIIIGDADKPLKNYWTTTFTQLQHAGSDANLICHALGIEHNPNAEYTLLLIDREGAAEARDISSIIPTSQNITRLAHKALSEEFSNKAYLVHAAMNPEYSEHYALVVRDAQENGLELSRQDHFEKYTADMDSTTKGILKIRQRINTDLGVNEHFLGNGLCKNFAAENIATPFGEIDLNRAYGAVEVLTHSKNPQALDQLENHDALLKRIPLNRQG